MLKKIRVGIAIISISLLTLLFLDFTGTLHNGLGWLANIQFIPALLAFNIGVIILLITLTLVFGRIYCSVICPLGIFQDMISWIASKWKKYRFTYSKALSWLRYSLLGLFTIAFIAGIAPVVALLDPYGSYGRIASNLMIPVYQWGNNLLAYFAERANSYAFYQVDVWLKSMGTLLVAIITLLVLAFLAWKNGRTYCNTICPVGTVLGFMSRFSIFKPVLDTSKCNHCKLCERNCKASCIDTQNQTIDYSRCVTCMDCIEVCRQGAIQYQPNIIKKDKQTNTEPNQSGHQRRTFLTMAGLLALASISKAQDKIVEGGLAPIENKKKPKRTTPIIPPGAESLSNFNRNCTACGLCISACPNGVLRPSGQLMTFMQPEMSYERGYCRPECTACSDVCPTNAIAPIDVAKKSATKIGYAVWIKDLCVVLTDNVNCGNCAQHCPAGAIEMIPAEVQNPDSKKIPMVNTERCIGCGACENLCPSRPFSAIYVEGIEHHRIV